MPIHVRCPECDAEYEVATALAGRRGRCRCGAQVLLPALAADGPGPVQEGPGLEAVLTEIGRWRKRGLISAAVEARLLKEYEPVDLAAARAAPPTDDDWPRLDIPTSPSMVLLYLGGILILTAVVMLLDHVWGELGRDGQFALAALVVVALWGVGAYVHTRGERTRSAGVVLLFFACVLAPAAAVLGADAVAGTTPHSGALLAAAAVTLAFQVATLVVFRSPVLTIPYPLSAVWVGFSVLDVAHWHGAVETSLPMLAVGLALMAVGYGAARQRKLSYAVMPDLIGSATAMTAVLAMGAGGHHAGLEAVGLLAALGLVALSVYRRNQTYLFVGAIYLMASIFSIGFEYFEDTAGLPVTLLLCGALSIGLGFGVNRLRREYRGGI